MFGIILESYLPAMLWCFNADTKNIIVNMYRLYTGKRKILVENITFYLLESVQNINISSWN